MSELDYFVKDYFKEELISLSDIEDRAMESMYWDSCFNFVASVWNKHYAFLSDKQKEWLEKIRDGVYE